MTEVLNNPKEIKIEYKGSCYFFMYHNDVAKYISLPQYCIEESEDVKIVMGNIITSRKYKTEVPKKKENKLDKIEESYNEESDTINLNSNTNINETNTNEETKTNETNTNEETNTNNEEKELVDCEVKEYFTIYRIGYSLERVDTFNSKEKRKILSKDDNIDVLMINKDGEGFFINVWKKHYSTTSELFITVIGEEVLKIDARELWSKIYYLMEKYSGKVVENKIDSILCSICCNTEKE